MKEAMCVNPVTQDTSRKRQNKMKQTAPFIQNQKKKKKTKQYKTNKQTKPTVQYKHIGKNSSSRHVGNESDRKVSQQIGSYNLT